MGRPVEGNLFCKLIRQVRHAKQTEAPSSRATQTSDSVIRNPSIFSFPLGRNCNFGAKPTVSPVSAIRVVSLILIFEVRTSGGSTALHNQRGI